jgi:collagenase-like PrtC family protease
LAVAANYDSSIAAELARYDVEEVYGKLPCDVVSGGRPSYMGSPIGWRSLGRYVKELARHGIAFNYLLNGACLANGEWTARWQHALMRLLDKVESLGIGRLTVSTPYLLELIKARRPAFHVKVGIYAQVDTPGRARFWEDLGADAINLESFSINRDFARLAAIRRAVSCQLQLIANHPCLSNCPIQPYHQVGQAHASDGSRGLYVDWCFFRCTRMRLEDPSLLIKSQWIRPEDLHVYEAMGYGRFKLLERGIPTPDLLKRVRAYAARRFTGNLAEILLPYGFRDAPRRQRFWTLRNFFRPRAIKPWRTRELMDLAKRQGMLFASGGPMIHIDSEAIGDDFLEHFRRGSCDQLCDDCAYCDAVAKRAVRVDSEERGELLKRYRSVEGALARGELWHVRQAPVG